MLRVRNTERAQTIKSNYVWKDCYLYFLIDVIIRWSGQSDYNNFWWLRGYQPFVCIQPADLSQIHFENSIYDLLVAVACSGCAQKSGKKCTKLHGYILVSFLFYLFCELDHSIILSPSYTLSSCRHSATTITMTTNVNVSEYRCGVTFINASGTKILPVVKV